MVNFRVDQKIALVTGCSRGVSSWYRINYINRSTKFRTSQLATIIYFGLTQLNKYPHIFNYITKITEDNAQKQYTIATRMFRFLKLAILVIFSLIILFTYLTTIGVTNGFGFWFLPFTFGLLLIPTIISISQSFKKRKNVAWQVRTCLNPLKNWIHFILRLVCLTLSLRSLSEINSILLRRMDLISNSISETSSLIFLLISLIFGWPDDCGPSFWSSQLAAVLV